MNDKTIIRHSNERTIHNTTATFNERHYDNKQYNNMSPTTNGDTTTNVTLTTDERSNNEQQTIYQPTSNYMTAGPTTNNK